jgi:hypothetical protein
MTLKSMPNYEPGRVGFAPFEIAHSSWARNLLVSGK